jgi:hypothetical protein
MKIMKTRARTMASVPSPAQMPKPTVAATTRARRHGSVPRASSWAGGAGVVCGRSWISLTLRLSSR